MSKTQNLKNFIFNFDTWLNFFKFTFTRKGIITFVIPIVIAWSCLSIYAIYLSQEPDVVKVNRGKKDVTGLVSTNTVIEISERLLNKRGGYLSDNILPPVYWLIPPFYMMDNMPNWEFGVVVSLRDYSRVLRNEISRSQSQSVEDPALAEAEPKFNYSNDHYIFPSTQAEYKKGIEYLKDYRDRLTDPKADEKKAHFYVNANNLVEWLKVVQQRLGSTIQKLGASTYKEVPSDYSVEQAGDKGQNLKPSNLADQTEKLSYFETDDQFYYARGEAWALLPLFEATEVDFAPVLENKNAVVQYRQIITELRAANRPVTTWMITSGSGFGMFPNHCLVMAAYLGSANAAISNIINLLENG